MRYLLLTILFISACCTTQTPVPCPTPPSISPEEIRSESQKTDEKAAWQYAEDEELISALETSDLQKWVLGVSKNIVLGNMHELGIYLRNNSKTFFRMSIFNDGTLFLDGERKSISSVHQHRLIILFGKIRALKDENLKDRLAE